MRPLPRPLLCLVVDSGGLGHALDDVRTHVARLVDAGVDLLQIRDRGLEADALFALTCETVAGARDASRPAQVIVNRRVDLALAAGAGGVHLGFDAVSPAEARARMGNGAVIGVSCHSADDVRAAFAEGADYVHLAPIFDPISKPAERPALGIGALAEACALAPRVIAQGGLVPANVASAIAAGAAGVAVTGIVTSADDPAQAVRALRKALVP